MKRNDAVFVVLLIVSSIVTAGIIAENIRLQRTEIAPAITGGVDVTKIKADIERVGLVMHEAKYWKLISP